MSYQKILVGIDGSKQAEMAFEKAIEAAKINKAQLYLLSVINGERYPSTGPGGYGFVSHSIYNEAVQTMQKKLADYKQQALDAGIKDVTTAVKIGNAKVELAERYPKENQIDLIMIGVTGLNVVGRILVGSTAAYAIREAPCDVTIVKTNLENHKLDIKESTYPEM